jgi:2-octaprenyl-6-methoxyphenol hydroxylase
MFNILSLTQHKAMFEFVTKCLHFATQKKALKHSSKLHKITNDLSNPKITITPYQSIQIIGCGLTGMIMALALAHNGIPSTILERSTSDKFPEDVRTTAFTSQTKQFLTSVGIWDLISNDVGLIKDIYVVDNKSPHILHMGKDEANVEAIGYILKNDFLKKRLYQAVLKEPLITLQKGVDITNSLSIDSPSFGKIPNILTLVCEGRFSHLKNFFQTRINKDYGQSAIVLVAHHTKPHECTAVEHFMPSGPFATLPMKDPNMSSIVWTEKHEITELYKQMPIDELTKHLQEKFGEFLGEVKILSNVQTFPLTAYLTKDYVKDNLVLVGDIAHAIHPLAGQGLNQGIKDIEELTYIISIRLKNGLEIDDIALKEYESARIKDNYNMFLVTDNLNRMFSNNIKPLAIFRKFGMSILNEMGSIKHKIVSYGMGFR